MCLSMGLDGQSGLKPAVFIQIHCNFVEESSRENYCQLVPPKRSPLFIPHYAGCARRGTSFNIVQQHQINSNRA